MKKWKYIILHHSKTADNVVLNDFEAIKKYHTSYRYNDRIVSKEEAGKLMAKHKFIVKPWNDIAYHYIIEYDNNKLIVKEGRSLDTPGAHCKGLNGVAIGICLVGDFDKKEPADEQYDELIKLVLELLKKCNIEPDKIRPHSYFAPWKSCPGHKFNWTKFIIKIMKGHKDGPIVESAVKPIPASSGPEPQPRPTPTEN